MITSQSLAWIAFNVLVLLNVEMLYRRVLVLLTYVRLI